MKEIKLHGKNALGRYALVDDEDYEKVNSIKWYVAKMMSDCEYAVNYRKNSMQSMHRMITGKPKGMVVDHINHNGFDNRKENLRICTHQQNMCNRKTQKHSSEYKGVYKTIYKPNPRGKQYFYTRWVSEIRYQNKKYRIGIYLTEKEAHEAYVLKSKELHGEFGFHN